MTQNIIMNNWKKDRAGRYVSQKTDWIIERSCIGGWLVINADTMKVVDHVRTKREATEAYD